MDIVARNATETGTNPLTAIENSTLYETLLDATLLSRINSFGIMNKPGIEQGYLPVSFDGYFGLAT
jgi:hypothetical protein